MSEERVSYQQLCRRVFFFQEDDRGILVPTPVFELLCSSVQALEVAVEWAHGADYQIFSEWGVGLYEEDSSIDEWRQVLTALASTLEKR